MCAIFYCHLHTIRDIRVELQDVYAVYYCLNMAKDQTHDDDTKSAPSASMVLLLIGTVADTTWRLFVPTIGGTVCGLWADNAWETKPWFTIVGVTLGAILAFTLVYLQIRTIKK